VTTGSTGLFMRLITTSRAETLTIGKLSELTGVNIETIRYYERTKVLAEPRRSRSGRRIYQAADVRTLAFLRRARELGFSLTEIRTLLRLGGPEKASCRDVRRASSRGHPFKDQRSSQTGTIARVYSIQMHGNDGAGLSRARRSRRATAQIASALTGAPPLGS
jgi:DNA-binding transcriptional MerR regulator